MDSAASALSILNALDDPVRFAILSRLMAGPSTVSELLADAGTTQSNVSNHLALLYARGLVTRERSGRHVAYALAGPEIAAVLEAVEAAVGGPVRSGPAIPDFTLARHCYDHLAGRLGVAIFAGLLAQRAIVKARTGEVRLGPRAREVFGALGIDLDAVAAQRRRFAACCHDVTEAKPHLAGALGAALQSACVDEGWLQRRSGTRALRITPAGRRALPERFGVHVADAIA